MLEKIIAGLVVFVLGVIQAFFWKSKADQDKRIDSNESSISKAHDRITSQANDNNEKFARRDDVKRMEDRLVMAMNTGFSSVKSDIQSLGKQR